MARFADCQVMKVVIARIEMTSGTIANAMIWCRSVKGHSSQGSAPGIMPFVRYESSRLRRRDRYSSGTNRPSLTSRSTTLVCMRRICGLSAMIRAAMSS
ncbi:hypothetical protein RHECNPAF_1360027 [Rhizobium etli CNPAF512]|nr:hypothetical protein RHECNPAF_1360027 [Rhizobium etli CNPAF512]